MDHLKLVSLNIEGDKHLDLVTAFLRAQKADVVCLQEVFERDVPLLKEAAQAQEALFAPLMNVTGTETLNLSPSGVWGVLMLSWQKPIDSQVHYYVGNPSVLPTFSADNPNSNNRAVLVMNVLKNASRFTVATTHFTWALAHQYSAIQIKAAEALLRQLDRYDEYILCGDFNAHRGEDTYQFLTKKLHDNIPANVTTTLDDAYHRVKGLNLVVDYIFSTPRFAVENVAVTDGLSDHRAVTGTVHCM